jgi:hypothetical protein
LKIIARDNIKNVLKDNNINPIINELVSRINKIVVHSYQFLKLYFIYLFHNNQPFPTLDKEFICDIFKVITKRKCNSGGYRDDNMDLDSLNIRNNFNINGRRNIIII